jgi:hypothetical protein
MSKKMGEDVNNKPVARPGGPCIAEGFICLRENPFCPFWSTDHGCILVALAKVAHEGVRDCLYERLKLAVLRLGY